MDIRGSCGFILDVSGPGWKTLKVVEEMQVFLTLVTQHGHPIQQELERALDLHKRALQLSKDSDQQSTIHDKPSQGVVETSNQPHKDVTEPETHQESEEQQHEATTGDMETQNVLSMQGGSDDSTKVPDDKESIDDEVQLPSASDVLHRALVNMKQTQLSSKIDSASHVLCTDTGGQPEYQEFLSLLMADSNTVFITFNLEHDLHSYQTLEYLPSVGSDPVTYQSPYTVGEMLCQTLISVPIHSSSQGVSSNVSQDVSGDKEIPNHSFVFFIGTHKDKVSLQRIEALNEELMELIHDTPQYRANIVQRRNGDNLIFAVNNFSSLDNDEDFVEIRRATQDLVYGHHLKVKAPTSWLFTGIALQNLSESRPMISLQQSQGIAEQCGVEGDSFKSCLKFLHRTTGAIRYYDTEHLKNVVIVKPQLLINVLSHLVSRAFVKPLPQKAIIEDEDINDATRQYKSLSRERLIEIALDLLVMCRHPNSTAQHPMYYLTCMLPVNREIASGDKKRCVYFMLEGFVLPLGVGRATITAIAQQRSDTKTPWKINFDSFHRNSLEFTISSPTTTFQIACSSKHLCLSVRNAQSAARERCSDVRIQIESIMKEVLKLYRYGDSSEAIVTFICTNCNTSNGSTHYATLSSEDRLRCSQTRQVFEIPSHLEHWVLVSSTTIYMYNIYICFDHERMFVVTICGCVSFLNLVSHFRSITHTEICLRIFEMRLILRMHKGGGGV